MPLAPTSAPTLRTLAAELDVSAITMSRALRGLANVRPELAARIQAHAKKRGYRADAVLAEVLGSLRKRTGAGGGARYRETVAFVWTHQRSNPDAEERGVKVVAEALGYRVDVIKPWTLGGGKGDISRMLWSRGIRGVLLAPNHSRPDPRYDLEWGRFCTVLLGSSLVNTGLTRVSRDYYHDATLALEELRRQGCRKPGMVLETDFYERSGRRCLAALLAAGGVRDDAHMIETCDAENRKAVLSWYRRVKPDGVVVANPQVAEWLAGAPRVVQMNRPGETVAAGVQIDFEQIGREGMHALDALLRTDRRGLLAKPISILVPGVWTEGEGKGVE